MGTKASRVRLTGPLAVYAPGFAMGLTRAGSTENATADQVRLLAHLSRWLAAQGLGAGDLTPEVGDALLAARLAAGWLDLVIAGARGLGLTAFERQQLAQMRSERPTPLTEGLTA